MAERKVFCVKLKKELPGLDEPPFDTELGKKIYENVSQEAWNAWTEFCKMLLNSAVYDTLILSDWHLGSDMSRADEARRMLRRHRFRRLILLGDIFSDLNFGRLTKQHWKFLSYIRKLSNPKRQVEVVWVEGN